MYAIIAQPMMRNGRIAAMVERMACLERVDRISRVRICGHRRMMPNTAVRMNAGLQAMVSATSVEPMAMNGVRGV